MTHREIFLEIAEAYLTPYKERTEWHRDLAKDGICLALGYMGFRLKTYKERELVFEYKKVIKVCHPLRETIQSHTGYWWPLTLKNRIHRGMACLLIADMGEKEFLRLGNDS